MTAPADLPSRVFECCQCEQTYFAGPKSGNGPHLCHFCNQPLSLRPEGAEPYSGGTVEPAAPAVNLAAQMEWSL